MTLFAEWSVLGCHMPDGQQQWDLLQKHNSVYNIIYIRGTLALPSSAYMSIVRQRIQCTEKIMSRQTNHYYDCMLTSFTIHTCNLAAGSSHRYQLRQHSRQQTALLLV
eukprot:GHUV01028759.1.p1 GENE.GHUV01028759.1~~GHUV01028759.1.p1  ORF type:complete len:108 (-),score=4.81 GHUV01028759.1:582-905(-)